MEVISIKWDLLGAKLAVLSDEEQAAFFTGFASELAAYDTHYAREMQMHFIAAKLKPSTIKTLRDYLPYIWFEKK